MLQSQPELRLRPEQQAAVNQTYQFWQQNPVSHQRKFLWNAKPRFGKTIAAYSFAQTIHAQRVLIITNRPAISDSWMTDFFRYFAEASDYIFSTPRGDSKRVKNNPHKTSRVYSRNELLNSPELLKRPLIFFISLPDLKGKDLNSQRFKQKNHWIFDTHLKWDLLIIDEGHDGVKTVKTDQVLSELHADFTLYLSGTPFRAIADRDFEDDQIYNWSYIDEQRLYAKNMPNMHFLAVPLERLMYNQSEQPRFFSLNNLFTVKDGRFINRSSVLQWLNSLETLCGKILDSNDTHTRAWFLRHSLWIMSGVAECVAMQKELSIHPYFKNYRVVLAAGAATRHQSTLKHVRDAISANPLSSKTITLSCGQLTTGITVPEWSAVLMLYSSVDLERVSATQYLQAAFRAQNPWHSESLQKTKCLTIDFSPDRVFTILQEYAVNLCAGFQSNSEDAVAELLRFINVQILVSDFRFKNLSSADVIELPRQIIAREIVDAKFLSSNRLFNINNIFSMSEQAHGIISKFNSIHKGRIERKPRLLGVPSINLDGNGDIVPNADHIKQALQKMSHNPKYATLNHLGKQKINNLALLQANKTASFDIDSELKNYPKKNQEEIIAFLYEVENCAKNNARKHRKRAENDYREKFRGFTQVLPILLHVYGDPQMTFMDLAKVTPDSEFEKIAGITKRDFEILAKEGFFNQTNCTLACREFMRREDQLSDYFRTDSKQSVFDFISYHQNNQVFTPQKAVKLMVEYIERQNPTIFCSPNSKFFDPAAKSGLFLTEVIKKLFFNLRQNFSSDHDCLIHILTNQIYAWSQNSFLRQSTINTLLRFVKNHPHVFSDNEIKRCEEKILEFNPINIKGGFNKSAVEQKIKTKWGNNMKFDVILGNPPYQYGRRQVYADFYRLAVDLDPEIVCMVFPTGWQKTNNHNGLGLLNKPKYKRDPHLVQIDNYKESSTNKLFPELSTGGVNIVLRDKNHNNHGQIRRLEAGKDAGTIILPIDNSEIVKPAELACLSKLLELTPKMSALGSSRKPYGFYADPLRHPEKYGLQLSIKPQHQDDVRLFGLLDNGVRAYRFISRSMLPKVSPNIDSYKLFVPKAWGNMSERIGLGGSYANICVAGPGDVCSETFIEFGPFQNQDETIKMAKYFMTQFFRALLFLAKDSQNTAKDKYKYIPLPDFRDDIWHQSISELEEYLFDKYGIPLKSQKFIRKHIQLRDEHNIEIL